MSTALAKPTVNKSLPSSSSVAELLEGKPEGIPKVLVSTALRSILIFPGIVLAGVKPRQAILAALLGSVGITSFIIIYMGMRDAANRGED